MAAEGDVAIIGMAGVYPQADDIDIFWANVLACRDAVTESPADWLNGSGIYDPNTTDPAYIYTRRGGFLGDLSRFDARRFGTMPLSVSSAQPDQLLALKIAHDALDDAGYPAGQHDHRNTGVLLGHSVHAHRGNTNGIQQIWIADQTRAMLRALFPETPTDRIDAAVRIMQDTLPKLTKDSVPGLVPNIMTGRICNRLDLMGSNYTIDAACSSSIIAVDLAMSELRAGRADMMLAGGVNTTTSPLVYGVFCSVDALSRNGRIRPFDSNANGTVLGEGAGIVVLKRLADALRDEDRIHAVIKGVGQSSDGKSSGLMAPRLEGEVLAVRRAYEQTGIDPATIGLIEAHGTGIPLGDRTEVDALRTVFGPREGRLPTVPIGSVKSMIGHCIPASGSAGIIKMAFALSRQVVPPTLCDEVSDDLGLAETKFHVATHVQPWVHSAAHPRRAAINAFGFGGINAHMILEESPVGRGPDPTAAFMRPVEAASVAPDATPDEVYVFAGADRVGVLSALEAFAAAGGDAGPARARMTWDAVLPTDTTAGPARLAIVASGAADLGKKIATVRAKLPTLAGGSLQTRNGIHYEDVALTGSGAGKVAFLFPGEMGQYPGMMRDAVLAFPVVRDWFDFISSLTADRRDVRLHEVIYPPATLVDEAGRALLEDLIHRVDYGSEMVFAADQAVFALVSAMGIRADMMLGHSTGENAALVASGILDMKRGDVGAMIARMNEIFAEIEASGTVPSGTLLNVAALDRASLNAVLRRHPEVHFTMDNCPNQAIVFGQRSEIDALQRDAVAMGAVCTILPISWGYHTIHVAPMAQAFGKLFDGMIDQSEINPAGVPLYSCGTARPFPATRAAFLETAITQYTSRVRFTEAVNQLYEDGARVFIECGPNAVLSSFVRDILGDRPHLAVAADNRRRGMVGQMRHLAAQVFVAGVAIDARRVLMPAETPDAARRRSTREEQARAPLLPSGLPYVRLEGETLRQVRDLILTPAEPSLTTAPAVPSDADQVIPADASEVAARSGQRMTDIPQPGAINPAGAMSGHMGLMTQFLHGQERVAQHVLRRAGLAATRPPGGGPEKTNRIEVMDLSGLFSMPFDFRACLMRGTPAMASLWSHLHPAEQEEVAGLSGKRLQEWSLARLAVKRAAGRLMAAATGAGPSDGEMNIAKDARGAPYLQLARPAGPVPAISIAHADAAGLGVAADARWRVGIDFDLPQRIRNAREFLETILSPGERRILGLPLNAETGVLAWSAKEAAAKALGTGLQGRPLDLVIASCDIGAGRLELSEGSRLIEARLCRIGDAVCALAYMPATADASVTQRVARTAI
jgi:3-oxoacyl-(acyl-carrier-protein) synthase/malonyl CoA-acyl carrier protein transacylase